MTVLHINGVAIEDGREALSAGKVAALDGVTVRWGRDNQVDQPSASTLQASLAVADNHPAAAALIGSLTVGQLVHLTTTTTESPDPESDSIQISSGAVWSDTGAQITQRAGYIEALPAGDQPPAVHIAPAPIQAPGTNPGAWAALPQSTNNGKWAYRVEVEVPAGSQLAHGFELYQGPWKMAATQDPTAQTPATPVGPTRLTRTRVTLALTATPTTPGQWTGVQFAAAGPVSPWIGAPGSWDAQTLTWNDTAALKIYPGASITPIGELTRTVTVFAGRIATSTAAARASGRVTVQLTATDVFAELASIPIGTDPFPAERASERLDRILSLSGLPYSLLTSGQPLTQQMSWLEVDSRAALDCLIETVVSLGGVLWPSANVATGAHLFLESPTLRAALATLKLDSAGRATIVGNQAAALALSASQITLEGSELLQDASDVASIAKVDYLMQGIDDDGNPTTTAQTVTTTDAVRYSEVGARQIAASTLLTDQVSARALTETLLRRTATAGWRLKDIHLPARITKKTRPEILMRLLDAAARIGLPLMLTDLPAWVPDAPAIPVFVEGGTYTTAKDGWDLTLTLTRASTDGRSIKWRELATGYTWNAMNTITWNGLTGIKTEGS